MSNTVEKIEVLLDLHIKQIDELKRVFNRHEDEANARFSALESAYNTRIKALEEQVIDLRIKHAGSNSKTDIFWQFLLLFIGAAVGFIIWYVQQLGGHK